MSENLISPVSLENHYSPHPRAEVGPSPHFPRRRRGRVAGAAAIVLLLGATLAWGVHTRRTAERQVKTETEKSAILSVDAVHPQAPAALPDLVLPATTRAYNDTAIYARTNGYIKQWHADLGAHVKAGEILAEIETPELDEQLNVARAELKKVQANLELARLTANRLEQLYTTSAISQQERDQAVSARAAQQAALESSMAEVQRLEHLQSFETVRAPFSGVITARNAELGALVSPGGNGSQTELFHLAAIDRLRVYAAVSESASGLVHVGERATVALAELPGEIFAGTIVRTARAIDVNSRTLNIELSVDNPDERILPGAFATVRLAFAPEKESANASSGALVVPANTLLFRAEGPRVALVREGRAALMPVKIGRDFGDRVELLVGPSASDWVIVNPSDSLIDGAAVKRRTL
jgi:RND family efflux transporter MFP subunit